MFPEWPMGYMCFLNMTAGLAGESNEAELLGEKMGRRRVRDRNTRADAGQRAGRQVHASITAELHGDTYVLPLAVLAGGRR